MNGLFIKNFHKNERVNHVDESPVLLLYAPKQGIKFYKTDGTTVNVPPLEAIGFQDKIEKMSNGMTVVYVSGSAKYGSGFVNKYDLGSTADITNIAATAKATEKAPTGYLPDSARDFVDSKGGLLDQAEGLFSSLKWYFIAAVILFVIVIALKFR